MIIAFTSCEGRKTKNQALSEDIEEFKKTVTVEVPVYEPESYMEREIDTLLHNGSLHLSLLYHSSLHHSLLACG